jgi:hypothetical protein
MDKIYKLEDLNNSSFINEFNINEFNINELEKQNYWIITIITVQHQNIL